ASCGIPVVDTIKIVEDNGKIASHLKRSDLTAIQTPQIFNIKDLVTAYKKTKEENLFFTDDTEVFSLIGKDVFIVKGDKDLIKITYKEDLKTAKEILKRNGKKWI
nr:2-C-methyl-D-erythritol 4-phosphate cytidylyltransferase [Spirochaetota bacterium]